VQKRIPFILGGLAILLSLAAAPAAFPLPIDELEPIDQPGELPIDGGGGETGGGIGTPSVPPFNPPVRPYFFAPNLPLYMIGFNWYSCNQLPHVWVAFSNDVVQGTILYGTGVVAPGSRVNFGFYNPFGQLIKTHLTQPARSNCVVHHEPEVISTSDLAPGYYFVYASYTGLSINGVWGTSAGYPLNHVGDYVTVIRVR